MGNKTSKKIAEKNHQRPTQTGKKQAKGNGNKNDVSVPKASAASPSGSDKADWLLVGGDFEMKIFGQCSVAELDSLYKAHRSGSEYPRFTPNYENINKLENIDLSEAVVDLDKDAPAVDYWRGLTGNGIQGSHVDPERDQDQLWPWSYYRTITAHSAKNPEIAIMPAMSYFVFAQYRRDTISSQFIPESLRLSLLENLHRLSHDAALAYDLRWATNGRYLHHSNKTFTSELAQWQLMMAEPAGGTATSVGMSQMTTRFEPLFVDTNDGTIDCITCKPENATENAAPSDWNSAFIHDMIDPNKHLFASPLWIPSIFDCQKLVDTTSQDVNFDVHDVIKSPILGLDYVQYRALYADIAKVFKRIQPMFEQVLGYTLSAREKVVVKAMKYVLMKPGDHYEGNLHREGMGENIVGIAIYYPHVSSADDGMTGGALKLSIPDVCNSFLKCGGLEFEIEPGTVVCFSNQGYHQLPVMEYKKPKNGDSTVNANAPISRTILAFFLLNPHNTKYVKASDEKIGDVRDGMHVNIVQYWKYYVAVWLRESELRDHYQWMMQLIHWFLLGTESELNDGAHILRQKMRTEKNKPLFSMLDRESLGSSNMCEETSYDDGYVS